MDSSHPDQPSRNAQVPASGRAARIGSIVALAEKVRRDLAAGRVDSAFQRSTYLFSALEVFMEKDTAEGIPAEISDAEALISNFRAAGHDYLDKREKRKRSQEARRQRKISEYIQRMVRRTARSKPKPKQEIRLVYTPFESSRTRH